MRQHFKDYPASYFMGVLLLGIIFIFAFVVPHMAQARNERVKNCEKKGGLYVEVRHHPKGGSDYKCLDVKEIK